MIRLLVQAPLSAGAELTLPHEQGHYLVNVMRRAVGDSILVFNGQDGEWRAHIIDAGKRACRLRLEQQTRAQQAGPDLELIVAVVKRARLETIIEKAAELGARRVRLVLTQHTQAERVRIERLQAIAIEASEQTGRLDAPEILEPVKLTALLDGWDAGRRLMFCDETGGVPVFEALAKSQTAPFAVLIGPEGGFSVPEAEKLRAIPGALTVSLGPRILRADTAAIAAISLWQAVLGDWRTS